MSKKAPGKASVKTAASREAPVSSQIDFPYLVATKRIGELLQKIQSAAVPPKFTVDFLKKLGFTSSNDRAYPSLLMKLGFIDASGVPTRRYLEFKDPANAPFVLAEGMRVAYQDLFATNESIGTATNEQLKDVIASASGAADPHITLIATTFRALATHASFFDRGEDGEMPHPESAGVPASEDRLPKMRNQTRKARMRLNFRYNIELHLPATNDASVYNAIFKSLREHLVDK